MLEFIIIRGPLGIGKTTVAKQLADDISAKYFSIDDVMEEHGLDKVADDIPVENFLKANKILIPQIQAIFKNNQSVVLDGNFYFKEVIEDLENMTEIKVNIFTLTAPLSVCLSRDAARINSLGQLATRAVYGLVTKVNIGLEIKANEKNVAGIIEEIKEHL